MKRVGFRLTQKTAMELIKQEFGLHGRLTVHRAGDGVYIYGMELGHFKIEVSNDWFNRDGMIEMYIRREGGDVIRLFFNPETLEENYYVEEQRRRELAQELLEGTK